MPTRAQWYAKLGARTGYHCSPQNEPEKPLRRHTRSFLLLLVFGKPYYVPVNFRRYPMKSTKYWWQTLLRQMPTEFEMQNNLLVNWTRQQHCSSRTKQISGSSVFNDLSQLIKNGVLLFLNTIRRQELRQIEIGLVAKTTIYEMGAEVNFRLALI